MRLLSTTILMFFLAMTTATAQFVLVNSPENIAGSYTFGTGDFGTPLTDSIWTADAVFVDDGTGETSSLGCEAAVNAMELDGKIAVVDRGACAFSQKALNAQNAGAIAIVIFNNLPGGGAMGMSGGDLGAQVIIPVASLSYEDGQIIRSALEDGPVNMTIGNFIFDNDLKAGADAVVFPALGILPISQLKAAGDFVFTPGVNASNGGLLGATNVEANLVIEHSPFGGSAQEVYNESLLLAEALEPDSSTGLSLLPTFDPFDTGEGVYNFAYSVDADDEEQTPNDNLVSSTFTVSPNLYSKASWNPETGNPRATSHFRRGAGPEVEFFTILNIPHGFGYRIDSAIVSVTTQANNPGGLAGELIEVYVYSWDDASDDGDISNDEVQVLGLGSYSFPSDFEDVGAVLRLPILDIIEVEEGIVIAEDDSDYIIGVRYQGTGDVFFGFDESVSYFEYRNLQVANGQQRDTDYGYLLGSSWDGVMPDFSQLGVFTDLWAAASTGIVLGEIETSTNEVVGPDVFTVNLFPNPATDYLQVNIDFKEPTSFVDYVISDMAGRVVFTQRDTDVFESEQAILNTGQLPAGRYNLSIRTEQGVRTGGFVVNR